MLETRPATECYFTDEETAACVDEGMSCCLRFFDEKLTFSSTSSWTKVNPSYKEDMIN